MKEKIWIEKYRPKDFKSIVGLSQEIQELVGEDMPHLLFIGSAGNGKTTTAKVIVKTLGCDCLELNASDERGIQTVREKVKEFSMTKSVRKGFKVVFLDEACSLTKEAQQALRRVIEVYSNNCRFILTGNYENKFIEPIQSRCTKFYFNKPKKESILERLSFIAIEEKISINTPTMKALIDRFYPDIRTMVNVLQRLSKLGREIVIEDIAMQITDLNQLWECVQKKEFIKARQLVMDSNSEVDVILEGLHNYIMGLQIPMSKKISYIVIIAESLRWLSSVINKYIEAEYCLVNLMKVE